MSCSRGEYRGSCRQRRYPFNNNRLVIARNQLYVGEDNTGVLPALPVMTNQNLQSRSTLRIFALLSPIEACAAVPEQPYGGGVLA